MADWNKSYLKLTSIIAKVNETDWNTKVQVYSQKDIKEIVQYAADRNIEVITEIGIPGYASAAILASHVVGSNGLRRHPYFTFNPEIEVT